MLAAVLVRQDVLGSRRRIWVRPLCPDRRQPAVEHVLAVPVGALLALRDGGYGVQISGGALTAVKVGLFADGMVQISGTGLAAGTRVVTTS